MTNAAILPSDDARAPGARIPMPTEPSDARLCEEAAQRIARPKEAAADSFVLHAPLELLARSALLPLVEPAARAAARARIVALGTDYAAAGAEIDDPPPASFPSAPDALAALSRALERGALEDVDAAASWLAGALPAAALAAALADEVVPRLGAAAHGGIFLHNLPRVAPRSAAAARMLRGLARELAREHGWKLGWFARRASGAGGSGDGLLASLLAPPSPGDPGSPYVYPIMHLVEESGLAAERLDAPTRDLDVATASRVLARVAAWSMLQDAPEHAPYGWSHCLTMPQGVLGVAHACADPRAGVAVAATYVLGFRAVLGRVALDPRWQPTRPSAAALSDPRALLDGTPHEAAAGMWYASDEDLPDLVASLATRAALHDDAHLVKYTLACCDAAHADPDAGRLYLAAAAHLAAWWQAHEGASPP